MNNTTVFSMVRDVPYMGVIWVVHEASKLGFWNGHPEWCNLGQGQPEVGDMPGAPERIDHVDIRPGDHAYGPVGGTGEVREVIADMVNRQFRKGKQQYTADNVSFASGGRLALTRLFTIIGDGARIAYKNPDYTAYEDYLYALRNRCVLLPIRAREQDGFSIPPDVLESFVHQERANVFVFSNPCNPTGEVVAGEALERYVAMARREQCLLGSDEFYSHFIYESDGKPASGPVSAAEFVEDVERDPVVIFDGLTKSHRYPGWRCGWAIGPKHVIEMLNRAASAVDGGPSMLSQRATIAALEPSRVQQETTALRVAFARKRSLMLEGLAAMGIYPASAPRGTFYVWASIAGLPTPLNDADTFFHACLARKVMTVPGRFFDIRPYRTRPAVEPYGSWVRFSYGPSYDVVEMGLQRMADLVAGYR